MQSPDLSSQKKRTSLVRSLVIFTCIAVGAIIAIVVSSDVSSKTIDRQEVDTATDIQNPIQDTSENSEQYNQYDQDFYEVMVNKEMVEFCLKLPLADYTEVFREDLEKAHRLFALRDNPSDFEYIDVQGFLTNEEESFLFADYLERDTVAYEESGLGILETQIQETDGTYRIWGYLPNMQEYRFVDLVWMGDDRVVLHVGYHSKDEALWRNRINTIHARGRLCTEEV